MVRGHMLFFVFCTVFLGDLEDAGTARCAHRAFRSPALFGLSGLQSGINFFATSYLQEKKNEFKNYFFTSHSYKISWKMGFLSED